MSWKQSSADFLYQIELYNLNITLETKHNLLIEHTPIDSPMYIQCQAAVGDNFDRRLVKQGVMKGYDVSNVFKLTDTHQQSLLQVSISCMYDRLPY